MEMVRGGSLEMHRHLFNRETVLALLLCLIIILLIIVTADAAPQWIYQGF
jgi:hypothetical protein